MKTSLGRRVGILGGSLCLATVGLVAAGTASVLEASPAGAAVPVRPPPGPPTFCGTPTTTTVTSSENPSVVGDTVTYIGHRVGS